MTNKYQTIKAIALLFVLTGFLSCTGGQAKTEEKEETEMLPEDIVEMRADQIKLANIETGPIEMRPMQATVKVNGTVSVAPENRATVCFPMGGYIKDLSLMPGTAVRKGQVLTTIENQDFVDIQQNYLETKNKLEYAQAEFNRHSELYKDDVYSEKNVQSVTADYKILKAQLKALEQKLLLIGINPANLKEEDISSTVTLKSPISGYITAVSVNPGKFVSPSDILLEIVNTDQLLLELTLFEKDVDKVNKGQSVSFFINDEAEEHEAVVLQTARSIDSNRTYRVYAKVTQKCEKVLPGMYVKALIGTTGRPVAALPQDAVVSFDDKQYVFVFDKNKDENGQPFTEYRIIKIKKGMTSKGFAEIILPEGFDTTEVRFVVKGAYNLLSAMKNAGEMAC